MEFNLVDVDVLANIFFGIVWPSESISIDLFNFRYRDCNCVLLHVFFYKHILFQDRLEYS